MKVKTKDITSATSKINDILEGSTSKADYMMLDILGDGTVNVCYNDPTKAFFEAIPAEDVKPEEVGKFAVDFGEFYRIIGICQTSGNLVADDLEINLVDGQLFRLVSRPMMNVSEDAQEKVYQRQATKTADLKCLPVTANAKTQLLTRAKYDTMFDVAAVDTWNRTELIDVLSRCTVEKSKQVYISKKNQQVFVSNQAYVTSIPIDSEEVSDFDRENLRSVMTAEGKAPAEIDEAVAALGNRITVSVVLSSQSAKSVCSVLNKCKGDTVDIHLDNTFCVFSCDNENERVGFWMQMPQASRLPLQTLMTYQGAAYKDFQMRFRRETFADILKYVVNTTADKTTVFFEKDEESDIVMMVFACSNGSCKAVPEETLEVNEGFTAKKFIIAPKVLDDIVKTTKSPLISFDFSVQANGSVFARIGEINYGKMMDAYNTVRAGMDPEEPTSTEDRLKIREASIEARQYLAISK